MVNSISDKCTSENLVTYKQILWHIRNCELHSNVTLKDMLIELEEGIKRGQNQMKLPDSLFIPLLVVYGIMIVFGTVGSFMVIFVVAKNRKMRTPRNLFILNLAISDLILCTFTQPFNLLRLLSGHQEWNLGDTVCRMTSMLQGTNILVSTFSITTIALDRFYVIVHPEKPPISTSGVMNILSLMWCLSILISLPFYFFSNVNSEYPKKCVEALDSELLKPFRVAHSYLMLILQYVVPMVTVSVTYFRICLRIKYRMVNRRDKSADPSITVPLSEAARQKRLLESRRQKKTNILLASIAIIFALSWLPLNTVNVVMDLRQNSFKHRKNNDSLAPSIYPSNQTVSFSSSDLNNTVQILSIQAICLLIVLCSACANPVLYGWLNENFKREFKSMFKSVFGVCHTFEPTSCRFEQSTQFATQTSSKWQPNQSVNKKLSKESHITSNDENILLCNTEKLE